MPGFDVFENNMFQLTQLSHRVNNFPFVPGFLQQLAMFEEDGIMTDAFFVDEENGTISLLPAIDNNANPTQLVNDLDSVVPIRPPRVAQEDRVSAAELFGKRQIGTEGELRTVVAETDKRFRRMRRNLDSTIEYHRVGAVRGEILDSDGTTALLNLFTRFGVTKESVVNFDLDNAAPVAGALRTACAGLERTMADNMGGMPLVKIGALCGDTFFDQLVAHTEVRAAYERWSNFEAFAAVSGATGQPGDMLRQTLAYRQFEIFNIRFINYRGVVNSVRFVPLTAAHFFPIGTPGLFITRYAPGQFLETIGTQGQPSYSKVAPDWKYNKWVDLLMESRPVSICVKPKVLMEGINT